MREATRVVVLAGGFGGARMAHGFALLGPQVALTVVGNTGDDLEMHGLRISPDLDTVMYTLAGLANDATGWGVADDTWSAAEMFGRYGQPTWFGLGDRDLATHITRTARLSAGQTLTQVTEHLATSLGVKSRLVPMSDQAVRTRVRTSKGWLEFQDYFVRRRHADTVLELRFDGLSGAQPTPAVLGAIDGAQLIVIAPSNPFVSVAPILALSGVLDAMHKSSATVIAVSPIVGGKALRGPAAAMMRSLVGRPATSSAVAEHYAASYPGLIDIMALDGSDATEASAVRAAGFEPLVTRTLIAAAADRRSLARALLKAGAAFNGGASESQVDDGSRVPSGG